MFLIPCVPCFFQQVQAILVNVFGGIVDCAIIANGITAACRGMDLRVPLVVRLAGKCESQTLAIKMLQAIPIWCAHHED